jgi:hypothetical protein
MPNWNVSQRPFKAALPVFKFPKNIKKSGVRALFEMRCISKSALTQFVLDFFLAIENHYH